jgi:hypothetical protein
MKIQCDHCNKIICENITTIELKDMGQYLQCPYCLNFSLNPVHPENEND